MKISGIYQNFGIYNNYVSNPKRLEASLLSLGQKLTKDTFESSKINKNRPSFAGLPIKGLLSKIHTAKAAAALSETHAAEQSSDWLSSSCQSRIKLLGGELIDTFAGLFGQKLKGKTRLKANGKIFDMQKATQGTVIFAERNGDLEVSVKQVDGKRLFSVLNKKNNSELVQDGACSYNMIIKDGDYTTTVNSTFTNNDAKKITGMLSTTQDASGKLIEVSEKGCNGREYTYNFINDTCRYREIAGEKPYDKVYETVIVKPEELAYSQAYINEEGFIKLRKAMEQEGWSREPIQVVRMKDGQLVSLDNRRLRAATETNTPIRAIIHEFDEPLSPLFSKRHQIYNPETNEVCAKPKSWGEIIYNRLFLNGFISDGTVIYPKEMPIFGKKGFDREGTSRLYAAYVSGKTPHFAFMT